MFVKETAKHSVIPLTQFGQLDEMYTFTQITSESFSHFISTFHIYRPIGGRRRCHCGVIFRFWEILAWTFSFAFLDVVNAWLFINQL